MIVPSAIVGRDVKEHVAVMERHLGRSLFATEIVHHKNGDRSDNSPPPDGNLELWETSHPPGQRADDKIAYAHGLLARYGLSHVHMSASEVIAGIGGVL